MQESDSFSFVQEWKGKFAATGWWHSFELPDGTIIKGVNDVPYLRSRIEKFPIPADLSGKRVLDIGAWDGWYSFEMERRGAEVVAIDCWDNPRFREISAVLGSHVDYRQMDVYELSPERIGRFDIVLFLGVLYHLKHPLLALERVCSVTTGMAAVDSIVLKEEHRPGADVDSRPIMEFYETNELGGQTDNWIGPSLPLLLAFCRTAGFARVEFRGLISHAAAAACYRHWEPVPSSPSKAPDLLSAVHHTNYGINFKSCYDEYVSCWFDSSQESLSIADVKPEVGGYGVRPIHVARSEGYWQTNFKLPPGLPSGWHEVRVRIDDSAPSNPRNIAVDLPLGSPPLKITGLCDGHTGKPNEIDLSKGDSLAIWVAGLPENADRENVKVSLHGRRVSVTNVEAPKENQSRRVNVHVPDFAPSGTMQVVVNVGEGESQSASIEVLG